MKAVKKNFLIAFGIFLCIVTIGMCTMKEHDKPAELTPAVDSLMQSWKQEKMQEQIRHKKQLYTLQRSKDSLEGIVKQKKNALIAYKAKATYLERELHKALVKADSLQVLPDSLSPMADEYFLSQEIKDSACYETIHTLEQIAANRDSSIVIYKQSEASIREQQRQQELQNLLLTEKLNTAYKQQRRKVIQNKFLAGGLIFLSGFTTTLILKQTIK